MTKAFVLGFYDSVQSNLDSDLRPEIGVNVIWFGKKSEHEPFEIGKFRSRVQAELQSPPPNELIVLAAILKREAYVLEIIKGILGAQQQDKILSTNDLQDSAWLAKTLRSLGFPQKCGPLDSTAIVAQYFGCSSWNCLCVRPNFQTGYPDALRRAGFPEGSLPHFIESIEVQTANTIQRVLRDAEAYSGLLYAHRGLKYMPPSARAQLKNKRFHEDTTTARVIEKLKLAIIEHAGEGELAQHGQPV